ncbi:MAG: M14 family metallopeptidase [Acidobacteriota bacterium]
MTTHPITRLAGGLLLAALSWNASLAVEPPGAATPPAYAATPEVLYPGTDPDPAVPTFREFLGFDLGEWFTTPERAGAYLEALAAASDRVRLGTYGHTYEGRPLLLATISSPENLARLEDIRGHLGLLRDPRNRPANMPREALIEGTPVVVWLAYSVHGDEHSGTEAALMTAYHLAADRTPETLSWLENTVVMIDPMQNPDGRARFLGWEERTIARDPSGVPRPDPDPQAAEHRQPWPGGRFNHYLFDLNRDWFFLTQVESRARVAAFREWYPHVFVDLHEMGTDATYFFPPPTSPINPFIPDLLRRWWEVFGAGNAAMLDTFRVDYYTGERFDAFYPGYGDSFPTLNGAVGMTYEQASARGLVQRRRDDALVTLREAAWHHFLTSLATIRTAAGNRRARQEDYARFFEEAVGSGQAPREYWLVPEPGTDGARELAAILDELGIEVRYPDAEVRNGGLRPLLPGQVPPPALPRNGLLIPLDQPQRRLARTLVEREVELPAAFLREQSERRRRKEPDGFYDITAWSLPLAYGARAFAADQPSTGALSAAPPELPAGLRGAGDAVAFLLPYDGNDAARALVDLLAAQPSIRAQIAMEAFRIDGEPFPRGTLIVKRRGNPDDLADRLEAIGNRHRVLFRGARSAWTDEGIDLGSDKVLPLRAPRVGLVFGPPARPSATGWIWYLMEQRLDLAITRIRARDLPRGDWTDLDVLIFPDADPLGDAYLELLGEAGVERLDRWVRDGGVFVGIGGGAALAARPETDWTSARPVTRPAPVEDPAAGRGAPSPADPPAVRVDELPDATPGAIARVDLDLHHYLTLGYGDWLAVPVISRLAFTPAGEGIDVARFAPADELRLSGFMWDETREALAGQSYLLAERRGRGKVILFAGSPIFRAYWPHLNRLLLNAVLLAPSL